MRACRLRQQRRARESARAAGVSNEMRQKKTDPYMRSVELPTYSRKWLAHTVYETKGRFAETND